MRFLVASIALTVAQSLLTSSVIAAPSAACASVNSGTFNVTDGGNFASSPLLSGFQPGEVLQFTVVGNFSGNTNTSPPNGCPYASKPFFFQAPNTPLIGNLTDGKNDNLFPQYTQASGNFHFGPFSYTVLNGSQQLGVGIGHSLCNPTPAPTVMISTTIKVTCLAVGSSGASLRSLQVTAAQSSGSAYAGMLQNAIGAGLSGRSTALNQPFFGFGPSGLGAVPNGLGMGNSSASAGGGVTYSAPLRLWSDGRISGVEEGKDNAWRQIIAVVGTDYLIARNLVVGGFAGYETFHLKRTDIASSLDGTGWTIGGYLGWAVLPSIRFDVAVAHSRIDYSGSAGAAVGSFDGGRWLAMTDLVGTYSWGRALLEPSAQIYLLHEHQGAYTDSLGGNQDAFDFTLGRASTGVKVSLPIAIGSGMTFSPYLGTYADFYFGMSGSQTITTIPEFGIGDGLAGRAVSGINLYGSSGWSLGLGGEAGNLFTGNATVWTGRISGGVKF